ncbi:MAG: DUF447 family protein [Gemmataceae bacterium]|nr:DUF447 family protein [Gemmataceae bacterium]
MILEGIVTTVAAAGDVNIAPMGPCVESDMRRFLLRPFNTSQTYRNLKAHGEGVLHVTDDVLLLAKAALRRPDPPPELVPATRVRGLVLRDCCRYFEFRVASLDDRDERVRIEVEVIHTAHVREFFGFNRAKHAVVEAAILATRTDFLPLEEIEADYRKLAVIVAKTGGPAEQEAFDFLRAHVRRVTEERALAGGRS